MSLRQRVKLPYAIRRTVRFVIYCRYQLPQQIKAHWHYAGLYEESEL